MIEPAPDIANREGETVTSIRRPDRGSFSTALLLIDEPALVTRRWHRAPAQAAAPVNTFSLGRAGKRALSIGASAESV